MSHWFEDEDENFCEARTSLEVNSTRNREIDKFTMSREYMRERERKRFPVQSLIQ